MRAVIQRIDYCRINIDSKLSSVINKGLMVLVGVVEEDNDEDIDYLVGKISKMRLFDDADGVMNLSVNDIGGEVMVISQFTLMASTKKGNRPSYINAAAPAISIPIYERFVVKMREAIVSDVQTGTFGADMKIELANNGPVTIVMDSKQKE